MDSPDFPKGPGGPYAPTKGDTTTPFTYSGQHPCFVRQGNGNVYTDPSPTLARFNPAICAVEDGRLGSRLVPAGLQEFRSASGHCRSPFRKTTVRAGCQFFMSRISVNTVTGAWTPILLAHVQDVMQIRLLTPCQASLHRRREQRLRRADLHTSASAHLQGLPIKATTAASVRRNVAG